MGFKQVSEFYEAYAEPQRSLLWMTREVVLGCDSRLSERLGWNLPVFYYRKYVAYLSVEKKTGDVYLGFVAGVSISDPYGWLESGTRKMIRVVRIADQNDLLRKAPAIDYYLQATMAMQDDDQ
jgi:hypothetical protein